MLCGILFFGYALVVGFAGKSASTPGPDNEVVAPQTEDKDYSKFTHSNAFHSRLPCLLCHRRDDNSARISFPGKIDHLPCTGCHQEQFSDKSSPICTICHTNADTGAMKRFPPLRSFGVKFDHSRHTRSNCATCHKVEGRGVARSIPAGVNAHVTCFQCHSSSSAASSCNICHVPGRLVRTSTSSPAFRKSFSHAKHLAARNVNCASCHNLRPGASRGRQMSNPAVSMHFAPAGSMSCGGCHSGKKAFGADDFSNCKRCHQGNKFRF